MENLLKKGGKMLNIPISEEIENQFAIYQDMLLSWNQKMNLTAITDPGEIVLKHFLDSISGEAYIPQGSTVIDVGTGAGFPGLPLKIVRMDIRLTLLDSLKKRLVFCKKPPKLYRSEISPSSIKERKMPGMMNNTANNSGLPYHGL